MAGALTMLGALVCRTTCGGADVGTAPLRDADLVIACRLYLRSTAAAGLPAGLGAGLAISHLTRASSACAMSCSILSGSCGVICEIRSPLCLVSPGPRAFLAASALDFESADSRFARAARPRGTFDAAGDLFGVRGPVGDGGGDGGYGRFVSDLDNDGTAMTDDRITDRVAAPSVLDWTSVSFSTLWNAGRTHIESSHCWSDSDTG